MTEREPRSPSDFHRSVAAISEGHCPLCDQRIDLNRHCVRCDVGWTVQLPGPQIIPSRRLVRDEIRKLYARSVR